MILEPFGKERAATAAAAADSKLTPLTADGGASTKPVKTDGGNVCF